MLLVTADQMRNLDRRTIQEAGVPGAVLMENAGRTAYQVIFQEYGPFRGKRIVVFSGPGNNGGDGFVLARYFHQGGAHVRVFLVGDAERVSGDARVNLDICKNMDIPVREVRSEEDEAFQIHNESGIRLMVDALLGTGLNSDIRGLYRRAVQTMNAASAPVVAVDIPSGLDSNRGIILGEAVRADLTVTFGLPKIGQVLYPGREHVGRLVLVDISIPNRFIEEERIEQALLTPQTVQAPPPRAADAHKGHAGRLFVLAGAPGKTGAAALTSLAAVRAGAGLVTLGVPRSLNPILEAKITEPMTWPLPETDDRTLSLQAFPEILKQLEGQSALALGPGLSTHSETVDLVLRLVEACPVPAVLDADALNAVSRDPGVLNKARVPLILTPHPGEMARLAGGSIQDIQNDRLGVARRFALTHHVVLVLKGARTLVAFPDGSAFVNTTGNPGLAGGGTGDVLTGIIAAFLARGMTAGEAAKSGVYLHGLAGDYCRRSLGPVGYLAGDLCDVLPRCLSGLDGLPAEPASSIPLTAPVP